MSVEADFGITDFVFQASGSQLTWTLTWPGVIDDGRYVGVSFQSDFVRARLDRVSEAFLTDDKENPQVSETIRATAGIGNGIAFRFSVVVIPSH